MENQQIDLLPVEPLPIPRVRFILLSTLPADETFHKAPPSAEFLNSLVRLGLLQPVSIIEPLGGAGTGEYIVAFGRGRIMAARRLGWEKIRAQVYPPGTDAVEVMAIVENQQRIDNPLGDLDQIEGCLQKGATIRDIQIATGMAVSIIKKRLKLRNLLPVIREKIATGDVAVSTAERIASDLPTPGRQQAFLDSLATEKIPGKALTTFKQVRAQQVYDHELPDALFQSPVAEEDVESDGNWLTMTVAYGISRETYTALQKYLQRKGASLERCFQERLQEEIVALVAMMEDELSC